MYPKICIIPEVMYPKTYINPNTYEATAYLHIPSRQVDLT
jgi:hypothetical protein